MRVFCLLRTALLGCLLISIGMPPVHAQAGVAPAISPEAIQRLVESVAAGKGRVEVKVGDLDPRLQLAPCERAEPTVPPGARLWGRSAILIRCVAGANWSVLLPVTVAVYGPALVARATLSPNMPLSPTDFIVDTIDLAKDQATYVADASQLNGRSLTRSLAAGQPLRADYLKVLPTIQQGDTVKVRISGDGFTITGEAIAMASAGAGQPLRMRTESGRVVSGIVREGFVEVKP